MTCNSMPNNRDGKKANYISSIQNHKRVTIDIMAILNVLHCRQLLFRNATIPDPISVTTTLLQVRY
jgi:hypothetical protein